MRGAAEFGRRMCALEGRSPHEWTSSVVRGRVSLFEEEASMPDKASLREKAREAIQSGRLPTTRPSGSIQCKSGGSSLPSAPSLLRGVGVGAHQGGTARLPPVHLEISVAHSASPQRDRSAPFPECISCAIDRWPNFRHSWRPVGLNKTRTSIERPSEAAITAGRRRPRPRASHDQRTAEYLTAIWAPETAEEMKQLILDETGSFEAEATLPIWLIIRLLSVVDAHRTPVTRR